MQRLFLLLAVFVLSSFVLAQDEPPIGVQLKTEAVSAGYVFFAPITGHSAYLIDNDGRLVKEWRSEYDIFSAMLLDNGTVLMGVGMQMPLGGWHILEAYDWDGNLLWSFEYADMHHAFRPMLNGNILITAWNRFTEAEILAMGLDPSLMTMPDITTNNEDYDGMLLDKVIELNPACLCVVWEWRVQDHLVQDYDEAAPNYGIVAAEPERINLNLRNLRLPSDRPHLNALDYNAERDEILLSAHYFSEVWVIAHSTSSEEAAGTAGDLLYRWGNPLAYGRGTTNERRLFLQHDAQWLPNGNILVFNNGMPIFRPYSSIAEIVPPETYSIGFDTAYEPTEALRDDDLGFHALNLGSIQPLANGHFLIADGLRGRIFETDAAGELVWEYLSPVFLTEQDGRAPLFKAWRIAPEIVEAHEIAAGETIPRLRLSEAGS